MKSDQTTKPFYPYYMTGSNIVLSRHLVRTTDGHGNHYLCCYVLFRTKSNQLSIATAWVKWIRFPNVSNILRILIMTSQIDYDLFYEQRGDLISVSEDMGNFGDTESIYEYFYHNGMEKITFNKSTGRSTVLEYYLYS